MSDRQGTRKVLPLGQLEDNAQRMDGLNGRNDHTMIRPRGGGVAEQIREVAPGFGGWQRSAPERSHMGTRGWPVGNVLVLSFSETPPKFGLIERVLAGGAGGRTLATQTLSARWRAKRRGGGEREGSWAECTHLARATLLEAMSVVGCLCARKRLREKDRCWLRSGGDLGFISPGS